MSGIVFLKSANIESIKQFYMKKIGMDMWLDQGGCAILKHGNMILGFCDRDTTDTQGVITFFYATRAEVDAMYDKFAETAEGEPKFNETYNIYNFFTRDPEGRLIEFQKFENSSLSPFLSASDNLIHRRSIRKYKDQEISSEILDNIFEECRYLPTAMNRQTYYFVVIKNQEIIEKLAEVRPGASAPIGKAKMAIAVCIDSTKTKRIHEDGYIASYHLLLTAHNHGLGTCWIADMDRENVKEILGIPQDHFIATVTPIGYPDEFKPLPERREKEEFVRTVE